MYIEDIAAIANKIALYIEGNSFEQFTEKIELQDAVIRRLQIVGGQSKDSHQNIGRFMQVLIGKVQRQCGISLSITMMRSIGTAITEN